MPGPYGASHSRQPVFRAPPGGGVHHAGGYGMLHPAGGSDGLRPLAVPRDETSMRPSRVREPLPQTSRLAEPQPKPARPAPGLRTWAKPQQTALVAKAPQRFSRHNRQTLPEAARLTEGTPRRQHHPAAAKPSARSFGVCYASRLPITPWTTWRRQPSPVCTWPGEQPIGLTSVARVASLRRAAGTGQARPGLARAHLLHSVPPLFIPGGGHSAMNAS